MRPLFTLEQVSLTYPPRAGETEITPALRGLSVTLPAGEVVAIVGHSGSGKTTLLNLLGQLWEQGHQGEIIYHDHAAPPAPTACPEGNEGSVGQPPTFPYSQLTVARRVWLRQRHFGFVLQSAYLLPHLSCLDNIALPLALAGMNLPTRRARAEELLCRAEPAGGLWKCRHAAAHEVSGGQRQRMAVLRAIIHNPHVVFADEPLSNLDQQNAEAILQLLRDWRQGRLSGAADLTDASLAPTNAAASNGIPASKREAPLAAAGRTLLLVSHDLDRAYEEASWFLPMHQGEAVEQRLWSKDELADAGDLLKLMGGQKGLTRSPLKPAPASPAVFVQEAP